MGRLFSRAQPRSVEELEAMLRKMPAWLRGQLFRQAAVRESPLGGLCRAVAEASEEVRVLAEVELLARYIWAWSLQDTATAPGKPKPPRPSFWVELPGVPPISPETRFLLCEGLIQEGELLKQELEQE